MSDMKRNELLKWVENAFGKIDLPLFSPDNILEIIQVDQKILRRIFQ